MPYALLSIKNMTEYPVISAVIDGDIYINDILKSQSSEPRPCYRGSRNIQILNSRGKIILDLWLSFKAETEYVLEVHDSYSVFKTIRSV